MVDIGQIVIGHSLILILRWLIDIIRVSSMGLMLILTVTHRGGVL